MAGAWQAASGCPPLSPLPCLTAPPSPPAFLLPSYSFSMILIELADTIKSDKKG